MHKCNMVTLPLSAAQDRICWQQEPWESHLDPLPAKSECEISEFHYN